MPDPASSAREPTAQGPSTREPAARAFAAKLPLARSTIDRDGGAREQPGLLESLWADAATRVVVLHHRDALLVAAAPEERPRLALLPVADVPASAPHFYLGRTREASDDGPAGTPIVAVLADDETAAALGPDDSRWGDLRLLGSALDARDAGLFTQVLALANWHRASAFSPRTGAPTISSRGGWVRHPEGAEEESSGEHVFPRTDPAIIVGVIDDRDRMLLASNVAWPENRFSVLAGFVEPGESFEGAVEREVFEESGLHVTDAQYLGSQPWPFPASIMVGFVARTDPAYPVAAVADTVEIREVRWFTREELAAATTGDDPSVRLPGHTSIARAIIEHWYGGPLEGDW